MKKIMLYILAVVILAGWLGTLMARDPGYVLLSYGGSSLQMGLWVFLGGLAVIGFGSYFLLRLFRGVTGTLGQFQAWRVDRRRGKSIEHTNRGLVYLQEGNTDRAEKFLLSGLAHQPQPVINYLNLARVSDAQGKPEDRQKYLRLAAEADSNASLAIAVAAAEMAIEREDWRECLHVLEGVSDNRHVLMMKQKAARGLQDWPALDRLLPALKKVLSAQEYTALEKQVVIKRITEPASSNEKRLAIYKGASEETRIDVEVLTTLCKLVNYEQETEAILRRVLKKHWHKELVELYGALGKETIGKRFKVANGWLKTHPNDSSLQFCLGQLYEAKGELDQAKQCYEKSIELGHHAGSSRQLANLLAFEGDHEKSNEYLRLTLND